MIDGQNLSFSTFRPQGGFPCPCAYLGCKYNRKRVLNTFTFFPICRPCPSDNLPYLNPLFRWVSIMPMRISLITRDLRSRWAGRHRFPLWGSFFGGSRAIFA